MLLPKSAPTLILQAVGRCQQGERGNQLEKGPTAGWQGCQVTGTHYALSLEPISCIMC